MRHAAVVPAYFARLPCHRTWVPLEDKSSSNQSCFRGVNIEFSGAFRCQLSGGLSTSRGRRTNSEQRCPPAALRSARLGSEQPEASGRQPAVALDASLSLQGINSGSSRPSVRWFGVTRVGPAVGPLSVVSAPPKKGRFPSFRGGSLSWESEVWLHIIGQSLVEQFSQACDAS